MRTLEPHFGNSGVFDRVDEIIVEKRTAGTFARIFLHRSEVPLSINLQLDIWYTNFGVDVSDRRQLDHSPKMQTLDLVSLHLGHQVLGL